MYIVPSFDIVSGKIRDGEVYTFHSYCKRKDQKCFNFYRSITSPGIYVCPGGYVAYATKYSLQNNIIYTSLLVSGWFDNKKIRFREERKNKFTEDEMVRLIGIYEMLFSRAKNSEADAEEEKSLVHGILHEVRRLNRDIDAHGTALMKNVQLESSGIKDIAENIFATIKLISIRIDSYELFKNPSTITSGRQPNIAVYKKFDKARYILGAQYRKKKIRINFNNESYFSIDGYEIFDLLPYIILDNAVKFSLSDQIIDVTFNDSQRTVIVENVGPQVSIYEIEKIFERGFRGKYSYDTQGSGLGLSMARQIADLHKIKCYAMSDGNILVQSHKIPYSQFKLYLKFPDS